MEFGIFDHCERADRPAQTTYEERFTLAQRAEQAGFFAYHLAEHHGTPLSLVPSPNLFLAALAQRTTKLRLGALVYLLPLYDPYRLVQEIGMLDAMSGGRLELGIGRGANPIELSFFGLNPATARERFGDAYARLMQGLTEGRVEGDDVRNSLGHGPIDMRTVQQPYPPIWYPSAGGGDQLVWAAQQGYNTIVNGPIDACIEAVELFKANFRPGAQGDRPRIGLTRYVYIADTDEEAMRVGAAAFRYHLDNLTFLTRQAGIDLSANTRILPPADLAAAVEGGWAAVGSPATVRAQLGALFDKVGNNYFVFAPMMGDLPLAWGLRTIELFENEIMPAFAGTNEVALEIA